MMIRHYALLAAAAVFLLPHAAMAEGAGDKALREMMAGKRVDVIDCQSHDRAQEEADIELAAKAIELLNTGEIAKVRAMLPELEAAGNRAPDRPPQMEKCDNRLMVYTSGNEDGMALGLMASMGAFQDSDNTEIVLMGPLPYSRLHFIIGWLYIEEHDIETADRWFARGLRNDPKDPMLASEHANALSQLRRSAEALVFVDGFLADNDGLSDDLHALLLRRRGYCLGELGRHDEAIAAYKKSLKLAPGNSVAEAEIKWNKDQKKAKSKR